MIRHQTDVLLELMLDGLSVLLELRLDLVELLVVVDLLVLHLLKEQVLDIGSCGLLRFLLKRIAELGPEHVFALDLQKELVSYLLVVVCLLLLDFAGFELFERVGAFAKEFDFVG